VRCAVAAAAACWKRRRHLVLNRLLIVTLVVTVEAKRTGDPDQIQAVYLEKLADELSHRGLEAWLMAPPGRMPSLYVVNPAARALEENVYVGCGKDGMWWFWWSWAERIAVADDVDQAASTIQRVLASLLRKD
jgi:hypothetical protein